MANIQITIPDDKLDKILNAFDQICGGRPQGTTKGQWAKENVIRYVKSIVRKKKKLTIKYK